MSYPTLEQVKNARELAIWKWYLRLPNPQNEQEHDIMKAICVRKQELGEITPEIDMAVRMGVVNA